MWICSLATMALCAAAVASPAVASELQRLSSTEPCNHCEGTLLPGRTYQYPETKWGIISDLPESFGSYGVLYSTRDVLPDNGGSEELRHQRKLPNFKTIDGGFDVFFFHLSRMTTGSRIVVYVKNKGQETVTLEPSQVIKSEGTIGSEHQFESDLANRVRHLQWDVYTNSRSSHGSAATYPEISFGPSKKDSGQVVMELSIPPGQGRVIAYGKQFGNVENGPEASHNVNCFGYARAMVKQPSSSTDLEVSVIAIPAGARDQMQAEAERLFDTGARSTDQVPMDKEQEGCALGRAVGVYPNFYWENEPLTLDVTRLDDSGVTFPMGLPEIQTHGCADARQTTDLVLRPGYTRQDTIGNYMIPYLVQATLVNPGNEPTAVDLFFSKTGADIGLAYNIQVTANDTGGHMKDTAVRSLWAGPKQSTLSKSLLPDGVPITLAAGEKRYVQLQFMICGNSSLPFDLGFKRVPAQPAKK
jgi:hypothetical protein